jgi:hypothetical protein
VTVPSGMAGTKQSTRLTDNSLASTLAAGSVGALSAALRTLTSSELLLGGWRAARRARTGTTRSMVALQPRMAFAQATTPDCVLRKSVPTLRPAVRAILKRRSAAARGWRAARCGRTGTTRSMVTFQRSMVFAQATAPGCLLREGFPTLCPAVRAIPRRRPPAARGWRAARCGRMGTTRSMVIFQRSMALAQTMGPSVCLRLRWVLRAVSNAFRTQRPHRRSSHSCDGTTHRA